MRNPLSVAALSLPLLLGGCLATQENIGDLERQMNALNSSLSVMQKNQAAINAKMDQLSKNLVAHSENLKDFDEQINRLSAKLDDLETAMDSRFSALGQTIKKQDEKDAADRAEAAVLPTKLFKDAQSNLMQKNYESAVRGFELYLEKFPKAAMSESAAYYLGDAYAGLGDWEKAAVAYAQLLEKYKKSQYIPAARIKYANALLKLPGDHKEEAASYLQSVVADYPASSQAKVAADFLKKLGTGKKTASKKRSAGAADSAQ